MDRYPMPKSSTAIRTPISFRRFRIVRLPATSRISRLSAISSSSRCAGIPAADNAAATSAARRLSENCRAVRLTAMVTGWRPSACHATLWRQTVSNTHFPI